MVGVASEASSEGKGGSQGVEEGGGSNVKGEEGKTKELEEVRPAQQAANRLTGIIDKIEKMYTNAHSTYSIGYDMDDPFIDDSDLADLHPDRMDNEYGGFFVHSGVLKERKKRKKIVKVKEDSDEGKSKKKKKSEGESSGSNTSSPSEGTAGDNSVPVELVKFTEEVELAIKEFGGDAKKVLKPFAKRLPEELHPQLAKINAVFKKSYPKKNFIPDALMERLKEFVPFKMLKNG